MKRSVVASVSLPAEVWNHAREIAKTEKRTQSEVVREALEKYYIGKQWEELQTFGAKQAKRLGIRNEDDVDRLLHEFRRSRK